MPNSEPDRRPSRLAELPRRLRLVFGARDSGLQDDPAGEQLEAPLTDFVAYATDCLVSGALARPVGRMSDLLNAHEGYELVNVQLQSLADAHVVSVPLVSLARDEIIAVHAAGPPSPRGRRTNMRAYPVVIRSEPYRIWGYLHSLPGADPLASFRHRRPMVPLTHASIEYALAGRTDRFHLGTLIVNRDLAESLELTADEVVQR